MDKPIAIIHLKFPVVELLFLNRKPKKKCDSFLNPEISPGFFVGKSQAVCWFVNSLIRDLLIGDEKFQLPAVVILKNFDGGEIYSGSPLPSLSFDYMKGFLQFKGS